MAENPGFTSEDQQKLKHALKFTEDLSHVSDTPEDGRARDCATAQDIQRIIDLGLGRGIDATSPTPWKNKSSYQVRPVSFDNIIGTEEGGCVQSYEREVTSISETRGRASASITDPKTAITIGVEAEYAQSSSNRYKVVGTKVLNRSISFKDHCVDSEVQPHLESDSFETKLCKWIVRKACPTEFSDQMLSKIEDEKSFVQTEIADLEAKLLEHRYAMDVTATQINTICKVYNEVQERLEVLVTDRSSLKLQKVEEDSTLKDDEITALRLRETELKERALDLRKKVEEFALSLSELERKDSISLACAKTKLKFLAKKEEKKQILGSSTHMFNWLSVRDQKQMIEYCMKFITQFRITHYVSSIQLGASGYEVLTQSKLSRKLGIGSNIGVEKIASGSVSTTHSKSHSHKASNVRRIGVIELNNGIPTVKRGSHQEAVVGIQVKPISDLVTMRELRTPLKKALLKYLKNEGVEVAGPFYIHCATSGTLRLYLMVKESSHVLATSGKNYASKFYIKPGSNPKHPDEFYICYYDYNLHEVNTDDQFDGTKEYTEPIPRYLTTPINVLGNAPGPLPLAYHGKGKERRLILVSNFTKYDQSPVSLSAWMSGCEACFIQCARRKTRRGFIAVTQVGEGYQTCCVHSKIDDESTSFMLFQLVKTPDTKTNKQEYKPNQEDIEVGDIHRTWMSMEAPSQTPCWPAQAQQPTQLSPLETITEDPEYEPDVEDSPSLEWDDKPTTVTEGSPPAADDPQLQPSWPPAQQQTRLRQQSLVQLSQSFEQIPSSPPLKAINNASDANQTVMKDKDPLNEETDSPSMEGDGNPPVIEKGNSFVVNERQFKATTV